MENRSLMYDGVGGYPLLYFKHVSKFVEATKMLALCMKKRNMVSFDSRMSPDLPRGTG
jgi:hypothetical protein